MNKQQLITELQTHGLRWVDTDSQTAGRKGGAGSSDHKAVTIAGTTVMVPIYTGAAARSPYSIELTADCLASTDSPMLQHAGENLVPIEFPNPPQFYRLQTADGIPYWKIALCAIRFLLKSKASFPAAMWMILMRSRIRLL